MKMLIGIEFEVVLLGYLGVGEINELVKNTATLASAEVAAEILILVGKRTLGWVTLGLMIWDFYDCLN